MFWIKNSLVVADDLTDEVWKKISSELQGKDDVSLKIEKSEVSIDEIDIPSSVSSVAFKSCTFLNPITISGLDKGRYFGFENCRKKFLLGNVNIENINCRLFVLKCDYRESEEDEEASTSKGMSIVPFIRESVFHYVEYHSETIGEFIDVVFLTKFEYTTFGNVDNECLYFKGCVFDSGFSMQAIGSGNISFKFDSSKLIDIEKTGCSLMELKVKGDISITCLELIHSDLKGLVVDLFRIKIDFVEIKNSSIGSLDLNTSSDGEDKYIHRVVVENSEVDYLYLRYREIVQILSLKGTKLNNSPEFLGANIPNGSVFPNKDGFISRNGQQDASCYRILRYAMESQRDRQLEGLFFSLEQESILNEKSGLNKYFSFSYLYLIFSDYGTNYHKPLLLMVASFVVFFLINAALMSPVVSIELPIDWFILSNAFIVTLKQFLLPFSSLKDFTSTVSINDPYEYLIALLGVIQSLIGLICLTLAGLAIRWKFKRG